MAEFFNAFTPAGAGAFIGTLVAFAFYMGCREVAESIQHVVNQWRFEQEDARREIRNRSRERVAEQAQAEKAAHERMRQGGGQR